MNFFYLNCYNILLILKVYIYNIYTIIYNIHIYIFCLIMAVINNNNKLNVAIGGKRTIRTNNGGNCGGGRCKESVLNLNKKNNCV